MSDRCAKRAMQCQKCKECKNVWLWDSEVNAILEGVETESTKQKISCDCKEDCKESFSFAVEDEKRSELYNDMCIGNPFSLKPKEEQKRIISKRAQDHDNSKRQQEYKQFVREKTLKNMIK